MTHPPTRRLLTGAGILVLALSGAVVTMQAASAAVGCQVTYSIGGQWPGGFTGNIAIRNLGDPINGWTLRWSFTAGQTAGGGWGATYAQSGSAVTATNVDWSARIATNATQSIGFNGTWNNSSNPAPTGFALNGVACTGQVTNPPTSSSSTSTPPPPPPPPGEVCTAFATIDMGKYWLNNNLWGQSSGSGTQCMSATSQSGNTIAWSTRWNWSGQSNQVKSFTSSVLGWHWGNRLPNTGLPVQLSANRNVNTSWQYNVNASGTFNVAYDLWFHPVANPGTQNPSDELMIWPYRAGGAGPAGTLQTRVTIAGTQWDLYRGVVGDWNVFSYVRVANATSVSFNLRDFTNDLVARGWMATSKYLTSVQAGTEVFIGNGTLTTTAYSANVQ